MDDVTGVKQVHHPQLDVTFQSVAYDADIDRKVSFTAIVQATFDQCVKHLSHHFVIW